MNRISALSATDSSSILKLKGLKLKTRKARYFFVAMAVVFPVIVVIGFFPSYHDLRAGTLQIHWLTHIHSAVMTGWIVVFLTQAMLAAKGNLKFHRRLGLYSFGLGVAVLVAMVAVSVRILVANHPAEGSFLFDLLLIEFYEMIAFGLFFFWGMRARKKDLASHKRLLTMATLVLLHAAIDRMPWLPLQQLGHPTVSFIYLDTLFIPLFIYDLITLKRIHRTTWIASVIFVALQLVVGTLNGSSAWHKFWFVATAPLMEKVIEVKLSATQSDALVGDYEGAAIGKMTISRDNGKLYMQFGHGEKEEMAAISDTRLLLKTEGINFSFLKDRNGKVTKATGNQIGRLFTMVKLKQP